VSLRDVRFPLAALPPEATSLRGEVRAFLQDEVAAGRWVPGVDTWLSGWDAAFSRRLGERGWLGMTIPTEYGGQGRSALERYVVVEELLAAGAPVAAHWIADRQTGPSLLKHGSEEQRQFFLPRIARGECYFAIGMSEPDSGSDLASVRTRADRVEGGWRLTGTKVWTSGAHEAQWFFVLARSEPLGEDRHAGLSQFVVDLHAAGVTVRPIQLLTGAAHFNEVVLDGVFVPDERVLGAVGTGWRQVTAELAFERSGPERFLSTYLLLASLVGHLARQADAGAVAAAQVGALVARLMTLREMSLSVAAALAAGQAPATQAALVKDVGTRFEQEIIEAAHLVAAVEPDPDAAPDSLARRLAHATLHSPGFTLRGGTNEILRGIVARALSAGER
jgi:alkylation response protein AidB-like acyl-CoA dehydrogenase